MKLINMLYKNAMQFKTDFMAQVNIEKEIASLKHTAKISGMGFLSTHVGNTKDGGFPVFIADDFIFVHTKFRNIPQAMAVSLPDGTKEIYVNTLFTQMPKGIKDAAMAHEIGHLVLGAIYKPKDKLLALLGLSSKTYLCETIADDYSVACGFNMKEALIHLRDTYGVNGKELNMRIARL